MRAAMAEALVGDDVFCDDPTVRHLEAKTAQLLGKEASLFLPSGTMANQVAIRVHTRPGDEVLLHEGCHVYRFEQGGMAALHGVQAVPLPGDEGRVPITRFAECLRPDDPHYPRSRLVVLENSHNLSGGTVLDAAYSAEVRKFATENGLAVHLDGARLANAAVALGVSLSDLAASADSVSLCLSKGLGAPIGTMLSGSAEFVRQARRVRKLLGGGMRQVGVLAAAGLLAIAEGVARLGEDHARARRCAASFRAVRGVRVADPVTNMVLVHTDPELVKPCAEHLAKHGVLALPFGVGRLRFVIHRDVGDLDVERAARALSDFFSSRPGSERSP